MTIDINNPVDRGRALSSSEVARMFRVDDKTPVRWAEAGRVSFFRTPSGRLRFWERDVLKLFARTDDVSVPRGDEAARDFIAWIMYLDEPAGAEERRMITLQKIIERAKIAWKESYEH